MKILIFLLAAVEIVTAALFLLNQASDIQLGFGLVFLYIGLATVLVGVTTKRY